MIPSSSSTITFEAFKKGIIKQNVLNTEAIRQRLIPVIWSVKSRITKVKNYDEIMLPYSDEALSPIKSPEKSKP
jgi:hypothetical protein